MALLFPRVIKSCTFKMTSDPCSLKQNKKKKGLKRDTQEKDTYQWFHHPRIEMP